MPDQGDQLLRDVTRGERKVFVAASAIGIGMVEMGVIPTRIAALGIEFSPPEQRAILFAAMAATIYFLVGFIVYAADDFVFWKLRGFRSYRQRLTNRIMRDQLVRSGSGTNVSLEATLDSRVLQAQAEMRADEEMIRHSYPWHRVSLTVVWVRVIFEFVVPVALGVWAVVVLFLRAASMSGA